MSVRLLKNGGFGINPTIYTPSKSAVYPPAKFLRPIDLKILNAFHLVERQQWNYSDAYSLQKTPNPVEILQDILATGRCSLDSIDGPELLLGAPSKAILSWHMNSDGSQSLKGAATQR